MARETGTPDLTAQQEYRIIECRIDGMPAQKIADMLGVNQTTVDEVIRRHVKACKQQAHERIDELFHMHDGFLEKLRDRFSKMLDNLPADATIKDCCDLCKVILAILHRQSCLWGLDKIKERGNTTGITGGKLGWLADPETPMGDILKEADRLGLRVPQKFLSLAGVGSGENA